MSDLNGATVGTPAPKSMTAAGWLKVVQDAGGDPKSIKMTLVPPAESIAALKKGTVDASQVQEPFITLAGDSLRPLTTDPWRGFGRPALGAGLVVTSEFYEANKDLVLRYQKALNETWAALAKDPDIIRKTLKKNTEIDPNVLDKITLPHISKDADLMLPTYFSGVDYMVNYGWLQPFSNDQVKALFISSKP